jgi:hypothetical protein
MTDDVRNIVLGVVAAGISAMLGWLARTYLWKRKLRRKQAFFGLPRAPSRSAHSSVARSTPT